MHLHHGPSSHHALHFEQHHQAYQLLLNFSMRRTILSWPAIYTYQWGGTSINTSGDDTTRVNYSGSIAAIRTSQKTVNHLLASPRPPTRVVIR
ncbi:hypothetical protein BC629DRAFT_728132 [Irpex lacteus]|nr:hypothetical protein BC629DRAFT_728132 [Irpex lacteus]